MKFRRFALLAVGLTALGLLFQVNAEEADPEAKAKPVAADLQQTLGGPDRYLTHISTDKPLYKPAETMYARGVLLHHQTNKPMAHSVSATIEVIGPKGDVVASGRSQSENSVVAFAWKIPEEQPGGEYTLKISHPWTGDSAAERKFDIRAYRAPRLKSQIKFLRDGYGPGDAVSATLNVTRAEGGVPADAAVTIIARVDGAEAFRGKSKVDQYGRCIARFTLPEEIARGEGSLAMVIEDGGVVETASKTIPILLQTVDLTMYPEGGEIVAGVVNRVYFEAFTAAKKPADLSGKVIDGNGQSVAEFSSRHEGRGRFVFTPKAGEKYSLKITQPAGINTTYPLPDVKADGVSVWTLANTFADDVELGVASSRDQEVTISLRKREAELDRKQLRLTAGKKAAVKLSPNELSGVLIATVYDADGQPVAERLVFVEPAQRVKLQINADQPQYVPGGKVKLDVTTVDEQGEPVSAVVGFSVTDDSVLEMLETRDQPPRLPVTVLLESDVQDLADANVYLDEEQEVSKLAVDLLLATQGWRRFALVNTAEFIKQHGDDARRALALRLPVIRHFGRGTDGKEVLKLQAAIPLVAAPAGVDEGVIEAPQEEAEAKPEAVLDKPFAANEKPLGKVAKAEAVDVAENDQEAVELPEVAAREPQAVEAKQVAEDQQRGQRAPLRVADDKNRQALADAIAEGEMADRRRALFADGLARRANAKNDFVMVRVYAHEVRPDRQPSQRSDFTETLYWHAGLKTDADGKATIEFALNDAVTSFRIFADAFNDAGALGTSNTTIESIEPFYAEPKLPLELTTGDRVLVPVALANGTSNALNATLKVDAEGLTVDADGDLQLNVPANQRSRQLLALNAGDSGATQVTINATAGDYADQVTRSVVIKPFGFPAELGQGGLIEADQTVTYEFEIPATVVAGSATTKAVVYPTPLASMTEALERLIRDPSGCFEQTSSTTYPLVMAQQYFMSHQGVDPSLIERSAESLEKGYQRLIGFECSGGGYEWFGKDPGHDALTAYGLLEFTDMAQVRQVDQAMLDRTRKWLLDQRDGKGGYERKTHTLHTWLPDPEVSNTYNTWALLEAGIDADLSTEVKWIRERAETTSNTYVMALAANVFALGGDKEGEEHMLDKLAGLQEEDGSLRGATVSVVGSGGEALKIETTSLAVMAWLKNPHYATQVEKGIKFLAESCKSGRYGSTQSTVLALRAIVAYDKSRATPKADGILQLVVDGKPFGDPIKFDKETKESITLPDFASALTPGKHTLQVKMTDGSKMPYSVAVNFHDEKPTSSEDCKVHLEVKLAATKITEGEITEAAVTLINRTGEVVPTPLAIVGIPGGLEVRHDQLKELVKAERIASYEVIGRDLVLYWRGLEAEKRIDLPIQLVAAVPGSYTGPASRAYLYYTDEDKQWVDGLTAQIIPRD